MLNYFFSRRNRPKPDRTGSEDPCSLQLEDSLDGNLNNIRSMLDNPADLNIRIVTAGGTRYRCAIVCIEGLVDRDLISSEVLRNIQRHIPQEKREAYAESVNLVEYLKDEALSANKITESDSPDQIIQGVLSGDTALFVDGSKQVLLISTKGWPSRGVEEPQTEALIRGPRDGFTENIRTNTVHIRRRIRDPNLRFDSMTVGRRSKREVVVAYMGGITHPDLVKEVKRRIKTMDVDDPEGSGMIEQWIADSFLTPFPLVQSTERPDRITAGLLQGKVAVLVDGTPFSLMMPVTIGGVLQSPEDYYQHWLIASLLRILRGFAVFLATFLPALYIALVEYHQGMIPSNLAFSIAGTREGVPFPAVVEAAMMEVTLEVLREAGIRLPKPIGQTIGIVGGLVIGEAAVAAGIVSPIMVIVVAITAISSFALPSYTFAISLRIIRFAIMLSAAVFGLYGIILFYILINVHLVNLHSFGVPYTTPFAPNFASDWKDLIWRAPVTMLAKRPKLTQPDDEERMDTKQEGGD